MKTLSGSAFVGGIFVVTRSCHRGNMSSWDCVHALLFSLISGALYGIGIVGEETGKFRREDSQGELSNSAIGKPAKITVYNDVNETRHYNNPNVHAEMELSYVDKTGLANNIRVKHKYREGTNDHLVTVPTFGDDSKNARDLGENDRYAFAYAANSQFHPDGKANFPSIPKSTVSQMVSDIMGRMSEIGVDKTCVVFNGQFGLWGLLQVVNEDTEHLIYATACEPYYNPEENAADVNTWTYTYQVHDEL
ncbi:hypothetical protein E3Q10_04455 [Wallemia mellicola]|uniref:Uncharacterized protein n=1 Tax=Wallemia mellicola TaxID=1708541 RepID=A0A4V4MSJ9_9BASI|nr:hypothetical protein E3Q10_04455 [Wallemia mellicola]